MNLYSCPKANSSDVNGMDEQLISMGYNVCLLSSVSLVHKAALESWEVIEVQS
jgi:hypothetical protein